MIYDTLAKKYGASRVATYYGETESEVRQEIVEGFQKGDIKYFIGQPRTGGYGLTLTKAKTVIYFNNTYDMEVRLQSEDRAHRIGQTDTVTYIDFVAPKTINEKIIKIRKTVKGKLPNIYLIDGDVSDNDMSNLYNNPKVKAMISLTKGEGFGRPLLEFSLTGKPIIASAWSGQIDFLSSELSILVGGTLDKVHPSAASKDMILTEAQWFTPNSIEVGRAYKAVYKHYNKVLKNSRKQGYNNKSNFSLDKMIEHFGHILDNRLPEFPKQVEFNLPELNLPKIQTNE